MAQEHLKQPIEVWLLTGCLGAGKTTTLNHLLRSGVFANRRLALIINEFGPKGVDGGLVSPGDYTKYEINKGSIFCVCVKTEFIRTIEQIRDSVRPEAVLVEATGIAQTRDLEQFLSEPHLKDAFRVRANLCIVDAENYTKTAAFLTTAVGQVQWADGILINKTDRVSGRELAVLRSILRQTNPLADVEMIQHGQVPDSFLGGLVHRERRGELTSCPPASLQAVSFHHEQVYDRARFLAAADGLGERLLRLKGNVRFEDGTFFAETVFGRTEIREASGQFPAGTYFTAIGWKLSREELTEVFNQCISNHSASDHPVRATH